MTTVTLNHDPANGMITDGTGLTVGTWAGPLEPVENRLPVADVIKLKEAGFEVEEIATLVRKEII